MVDIEAGRSIGAAHTESKSKGTTKLPILKFGEGSFAPGNLGALKHELHKISGGGLFPKVELGRPKRAKIDWTKVGDKIGNALRPLGRLARNGFNTPAGGPKPDSR